MPPALTPDLALDYLAQLSTDIRAAVVLDPAGEKLAGEDALAGPARELLDAAPEAAGIEAIVEGGGVFAARDAHHQLAVVTGRYALPALVHYDLRLVLADLTPDGGSE